MKLDIGGTLKKKREELNLTLEDIASKTLIRPYYLEQIENNEFKRYNGFINAYIRKYAETLGMDPEPLLNAYKSLFEEEEKKEVNPRKKTNYKIIVSLIVILCIVLIPIFFLMHRNANTVHEQPEISTPSENKSVTPPQQKNEQPPKENVQKPPSQKENKITGIHVTVSADALCWLGVTIDGKYSQLFLRKGESRTFDGNKYIKIRFGNATHAYVTVNGKKLGVVSKDKKVVEKVYKP